MDKETYYALAILASSVSALLAFINVFILLRDRSGGLKLKFMVRQGTSTARALKELTNLNFDDPPEAYKAVALIENRSAIPVVLTAFSLDSRRFWWLPFFDTKSEDIDGIVVDQSIPAKVEGRSFVIFEFRGSVTSIKRYEELVISTTEKRYSHSVPVALKHVFHRP